MKKTITVNGTLIEYTHKKSAKAKRIRIAIYRGGEIILTTPVGMPELLAVQFFRSKAGWVLEKYAKAKTLPPPDKADTRGEYLKHKTAALKLVKERLVHFNQHYGFKYNRVSIKNHKSLWGSCSRRGNLNFNYKLALVSPELADYVIVHELCHLKEFNHSPKFWSLVAETIPDYKQLRKAIKGLQ